MGEHNTLPMELQALTTTVTTPDIYALGTSTTAVSFASSPLRSARSPSSQAQARHAPTRPGVSANAAARRSIQYVRSMTQRIGAAAGAAAGPGVEVVAVNPAHGPASDRGLFRRSLRRAGAGRRSGEGRRRRFRRLHCRCFDDTGLEAARSAARGPVIGIGEAAFHVAALIAHRFSVVTTLSRSIAPIEANR